jgi:threonine/homoserine/homoserine lactone efflux protein
MSLDADLLVVAAPDRPLASGVLAGFLLGYAAVLAVPGPNMLAIGTISALRGLRAVLPFCLGVAVGAGLLALSLHLTLRTVAGVPGTGWACRAAGAALLLFVALRMLRAPSPGAAGRQVAQAALGPDDIAAFCAGACTAVANPVTGAYFAAQLLGPLALSGHTLAALTLVPIQALVVGLAVAMVLARPAARRAALAWHRPLRLVSCAQLVLLAAGIASPLLWS